MATPLKRIRVDDGLWNAFGDAAEAMGSDRTKLLVAFMRRYVAATSPEPVTRSDTVDHATRPPNSAT
jgi:hypothetical protein